MGQAFACRNARQHRGSPSDRGHDRRTAAKWQHPEADARLRLSTRPSPAGGAYPKNASGGRSRDRHQAELTDCVRSVVIELCRQIGRDLEADFLLSHFRLVPFHDASSSADRALQT